MRIYRKRPVIAVCCSDIHLSLKPPLAREVEEDWLKAQARTLRQLRRLAIRHQAPVLCAGDIFDVWHSPAELINFALEHLPPMYAIPGNHDLPSHRLDLAHRSAYGTLVAAKKVVEVPPDGMRLTNSVGGELVVYGFPFKGEDITAPKDKYPGEIHAALIHEYVWVKGRGYFGADKGGLLRAHKKRFQSFDAVVIGDNHQAFHQVVGSTQVMNCGTLMRRKSNEADYTPQVGLLHADGSMSSHSLSIKGEMISVLEEVEMEERVEHDFISHLAGLEASSLNYRDAIFTAMDRSDVPDQVREILTEVLDES